MGKKYNSNAAPLKRNEMSEDGLGLPPCMKKGGQVPFLEIVGKRSKRGNNNALPGKTHKVKRKLSLLELDEYLNNASQAFKINGVSR